jgi:hypothetical protein
MLCIKVIDNRKERRESLATWLSGLGHQVFAYESADAERNDDQACNTQVIFIHVGEHQKEALNAVQSYDKSIHIVGYTADVRTAERAYLSVEASSSNFCLYRQIYASTATVQDPPQSVQSDFKSYLATIQAGGDLCKSLNSFNKILESKLDMLAMIAKGVPAEEVLNSVSGLVLGDHFDQISNKPSDAGNLTQQSSGVIGSSDIDLKNLINDALNSHDNFIKLRNLFFPE